MFSRNKCRPLLFEQTKKKIVTKHIFYMYLKNKLGSGEVKVQHVVEIAYSNKIINLNIVTSVIMKSIIKYLKLSTYSMQ
jgi:hypothetical protein